MRRTRSLWIAAERLPQFQALWPDATARPGDRGAGGACRRATGRATRRWSKSCAAGWKGSGPVTAACARGAARPGAGRDRRPRWRRSRPKALRMRGRFTPGAAADEWCERRLLARIHRYTVKRLRAEIEPVAARDFLRFLFAWQRVRRRRAHGGPGRARRGRRAARRLRGAGRRLGDRDPAGARSPATSRPGSTTAASPAASPGRGSSRAPARQRQRAQARRRCARRRSPCCRAACAALGLAVRRRPTRRSSSARRASGRRLHPRSTARRSSTSWSTAPACCAPRSRRRWPSWSRSAS